MNNYGRNVLWGILGTLDKMEFTKYHSEEIALSFLNESVKRLLGYMTNRE